MRYKVPQNIDMEDRIVGPLTMVQFVTVMVGGMIIYLSYLLFTPTSFWIIAVPVGLATLALAFLKINDQPFPKFLAATLLFLVRPKNRVWQKTDAAEPLSITHQPTAQETRQTGQSTVQAGDLAGLATVLDTGGTVPIPTTPPPTPVPAPMQEVVAADAASARGLSGRSPDAGAAAIATAPTQVQEATPLEQDQLVTIDKLASLRAAATEAPVPVVKPAPSTPDAPTQPLPPTPGAA